MNNKYVTIQVFNMMETIEAQLRHAGALSNDIPHPSYI